MFGEDAIPRPSGAPRKSKSQRSSASSSATSGSSKNRLTEFFQEQIQLDREAKKESLDRELAARLVVVGLQKRNEDLKILTFDITGMNPDDAAKIEALKDKTRATGDIRGTGTQPSPKNMIPVVEETPNADGSVRNTADKGEGAQRDLPSSSIMSAAMREFCEKHYEQILSFMTERAHTKKLKDARSRLSYSESTEQETENTSHYEKRKKKRGGKKKEVQRSSSASRSRSVFSQLGALPGTPEQ
ncbi:hypothetical protein Tco_1300196 [Tanacetum coccineum]